MSDEPTWLVVFCLIWLAGGVVAAGYVVLAWAKAAALLKAGKIDRGEESNRDADALRWLLFAGVWPFLPAILALWGLWKLLVWLFGLPHREKVQA